MPDLALVVENALVEARGSRRRTPPRARSAVITPQFHNRTNLRIAVFLELQATKGAPKPYASATDILVPTGGNMPMPVAPPS